MTIAELITPYKVDRKEVTIVIDNFIGVNEDNFVPNEQKVKVILNHLKNIDVNLFNSINIELYKKDNPKHILIVEPDTLVNKMKYEFLINNINNIKLEDLETLIK